MPDASYEIYRKSTDDAGVALIHIGTAPAANALSAVRAWYRAASPESSPGVDGETLVVIPTRSHHELTPTVEVQPRLSFS